MSLIIGLVPFPVVPGSKPVVGNCGDGILGIDVAIYPDGTPLSLQPMRGRRFTLYGVRPNGADNGAIVYIGQAGTNGQPQPLEPGKDEYISIVSPDDSFINLQDYFVVGTDGDNVKWIKIA